MILTLHAQIEPPSVALAEMPSHRTMSQKDGFLQIEVYYITK